MVEVSKQQQTLNLHLLHVVFNKRIPLRWKIYFCPVTFEPLNFGKMANKKTFKRRSDT